MRPGPFSGGISASSGLDYSSKIISLGDYTINFLGNFPSEIADIINLYGLENKICDPTRFGSNSYSLLDPILFSDSITVIESTTIPINRAISDHDLTYIVVSCGYHNDISFKMNVRLYNKGNYELFNQRVGDTDWDGIINNQTDIYISCNLFTKEFMQIAHEYIPANCVTIRHNDKIWMTSDIRKEIRIRDRLRKKYFKNKIGTNEHKYKNQRNKRE